MGRDSPLCWPEVVWLPLKLCYTQLTAHSTPGGPARSGRLWVELGDPEQGQVAEGENLSLGRWEQEEMWLRKFLSVLGCTVNREGRPSETLNILDASDFKKFIFSFLEETLCWQT